MPRLDHVRPEEKIESFEVRNFERDGKQRANFGAKVRASRYLLIQLKDIKVLELWFWVYLAEKSANSKGSWAILSLDH